MNVIPCFIKALKGLYDISGVEVGQHLYWQKAKSLGILSVLRSPLLRETPWLLPEITEQIRTLESPRRVKMV